MRQQQVDKGGIQGILEEGFGPVAKKVMRDPNLKIGAKALYSYLVSFAGAGMTAWPKKATICKELGIHEETYNKYLSQLIERDYVRVQPRKGEGGKFLGNLYIIVADPNPQEPDVEKYQMRESSVYGKEPNAEKTLIHINNNQDLKKNKNIQQQQRSHEEQTEEEENVVVLADKEEEVVTLFKFEGMDVEDTEFIREIWLAANGDINRIRNALYACKEFAQANKVSNPTGLLLAAIKGNKKPSPGFLKTIFINGKSSNKYNLVYNG